MTTAFLRDHHSTRLYMSSTCTPKQMSNSAFTNKQGSRSSWMKLCSFNFFDRCSCQRLGDVRRPSMALRALHTTCLPSCSSLGLHPSGGCTYNCSPSRTSACVQSFIETSCQEHTDALNCCCCCKATFVTLRTWISKLLEFSSRPPNDQT